MAKETAAAPKMDKVVGQIPKVQWNDGSMKTNYSNVCNVLSSKEEVTLLFGTNQTLYTGQDEVTVDLSNRVILSPHRAKVLSMLLNNVLNEYENRFGKLAVEPAAKPATDA